MRKVYGLKWLNDVREKGTKTEFMHHRAKMAHAEYHWNGPGHYAIRNGPRGRLQVIQVNPEKVRLPKRAFLGYAKDEADLLMLIGKAGIWPEPIEPESCPHTEKPWPAIPEPHEILGRLVRFTCEIGMRSLRLRRRIGLMPPWRAGQWYRAALAYRAAKHFLFLKWGHEKIFPRP
jgi:hypothetical protein